MNVPWTRFVKTIAGWFRPRRLAAPCARTSVRLSFSAPSSVASTRTASLVAVHVIAQLRRPCPSRSTRESFVSRTSWRRRRTRVQRTKNEKDACRTRFCRDAPQRLASFQARHGAWRCHLERLIRWNLMPTRTTSTLVFPQVPRRHEDAA